VNRAGRPQALGENLVLSSKNFDAPVHFAGSWGVHIAIPATPFQMLVTKQSDKEPVLLTYIAGFLTVGRTRLMATEVQ
jgi:hypothetical protein